MSFPHRKRVLRQAAHQRGPKECPDRKSLTNKNYMTMDNIYLNTDDVLRDLARQFADGKMDTETYLETMEDVCIASVTNTMEG